MKTNMQGLLREVFNTLTVGEVFTMRLLLSAADIPRDTKSGYIYIHNVKKGGYCKESPTLTKASRLTIGDPPHFEKIKDDDRKTGAVRKRRKSVIKKPVEVEDNTPLTTTGTEILDQILLKIEQYKNTIQALTTDLKAMELESDKHVQSITTLQEKIIVLKKQEPRTYNLIDL